LTGFFDSLEALGRNFDLAYSMMVYVLEALSKSAPKTASIWEDYEEGNRLKLDEQLLSVSTEVANNIRSVLRNNPHLKLMRRFTEFVSAHVDDTYFTSEAEGLNFALAKSDLPRALKNLYNARSGYVHGLAHVMSCSNSALRAAIAIRFLRYVNHTLPLEVLNA